MQGTIFILSGVTARGEVKSKPCTVLVSQIPSGNASMAGTGKTGSMEIALLFINYIIYHIPVLAFKVSYKGKIEHQQLHKKTDMCLRSVLVPFKTESINFPV